MKNVPAATSGKPAPDQLRRRWRRPWVPVRRASSLPILVALLKLFV